MNFNDRTKPSGGGCLALWPEFHAGGLTASAIVHIRRFRPGRDGYASCEWLPNRTTMTDGSKVPLGKVYEATIKCLRIQPPG